MKLTEKDLDGMEGEMFHDCWAPSTKEGMELVRLARLGLWCKEHNDAIVESLRMQDVLYIAGIKYDNALKALPATQEEKKE